MKKYFWWPLTIVSFVGVYVFFIIAIATMMRTYTIQAIWWKLLAASLVVNFICGLAINDDIDENTELGGTEGWY